MYVCVYVFMYICVCVCIYVYMYVCMYVRICVCVCVCMYVFVCVWMHTRRPTYFFPSTWSLPNCDINISVPRVHIPFLLQTVGPRPTLQFAWCFLWSGTLSQRVVCRHLKGIMAYLGAGLWYGQLLVQTPGGTRTFSVLGVLTDCGAHPAVCWVDKVNRC